LIRASGTGIVPSASANTFTEPVAGSNVPQTTANCTGVTSVTLTLPTSITPASLTTGISKKKPILLAMIEKIKELKEK